MTRSERKERKREEEEIRILRDIDHTEHEILDDLRPKLGSIKIRFSQGELMPEGPLTLQAGQSAIASIDYFDTTGAPMAASFVPPPVTYAIDQAAIASFAENADNQTGVVTYVTAGVANLSASVAGPNGALTDTETVTCAPAVTPPQTLGSIKINFAAPTPAALTKASPPPNAPPLTKGQVGPTGRQV